MKQYDVEDWLVSTYYLWYVFGIDEMPQGCRWFMTKSVDDLPGVTQCQDCGIFIDEDGRVLSPQIIYSMRRLNEAQ